MARLVRVLGMARVILVLMVRPGSLGPGSPGARGVGVLGMGTLGMIGLRSVAPSRDTLQTPPCSGT
ncbi:hypothetical protein GCM10027063_12330 [Promicromonospora xylanilytica]